MPDLIQQFLKDAASKRLERTAPAQRRDRQRVDARNARLQSAPIVRGPNAPKDGSFGGVKK